MADFRTSDDTNHFDIKYFSNNFFLFVLCCGDLRFMLGTEATQQARQVVFVEAGGGKVKPWVQGGRPVNSSL